MNYIDNPARLKAAATYDAAADHFDDPPLAFWDRHGRRTVELLNLQPGCSVLDVGCGTGASALPAAHAVGPRGHVLGIDVAEKMLDCARAKAAAQRLNNVTFTVADMLNSGLPDGKFDAVISVFSVFFVADMERQVAELWRLVRPGGRLAVTVWGPNSFEPWMTIFSDEVCRVRPDFAVATRPWERLTDPDNLRQLFRDGGAAEPVVEAVEDSQPIVQPNDWWTIGIGSGFRWEIGQLTAAQAHTVKARTLSRLTATGIDALCTNANYAVATK
jgi:ubiquinone/menaquinone biosynthesis C-methylase UbiE